MTEYESLAHARYESAEPARWFVAKTRPNNEHKALFHLRRQGFEVYLPQFLRRIRHARRTSWQPRPLFPSYLFVAISEARRGWHAINSTIGISHLITDDRGPVPVPPSVIKDLQDTEDDDGLILTGRKTPFKKGAAVQIMSGAFADHVGRFENATDSERVTILLDLLGREVRAKVKLDAITAHA